MTIMTCKKCGQPVVLLKTTKGNTVVCDLPAIKFTHNLKGKNKVISVNGEVLKGTVGPEGEELGYTPHECK